MSIRPSEITDLQDRVRRRGYAHYLHEMEIKRLRGFNDAHIQFDFPVTAIVGPNGSGKTTVLGAAGLIYEEVQPRRFFARGGAYDSSMSGWRVEYQLRSRGSEYNRVASYSKHTSDTRRSKWNRKAVNRPVKVIGITRTLPMSERTDVWKFAKGTFVGRSEREFEEQVIQAVERILGKQASAYLEASADAGGKDSILAHRPKDTSSPAYSEFHFGAGEASIIRIVGEIEAVEDNALVLIEEVENGLHPVATKHLVEYFIEVARRKGCQIIFSTHSNAALKPLPSDAVWSAYRGKLTQGKLDVESLRALTGEVSARLAIFTEDKFSSLLAEATLRQYGDALGERLDLKGIEIHALGGAAPARDQAKHNNLGNPAQKFLALALLDGDKRLEDGYSESSTPSLELPDGQRFITFIPGDEDPERIVVEDIAESIESNPRILPKLILALQLDTPHQGEVREAIESTVRNNRDIHTFFAEIGESLDFLSEDVVSRAFVSIWAMFYVEKIKIMWDPVQGLLPRLSDTL